MSKSNRVVVTKNYKNPLTIPFIMTRRIPTQILNTYEKSGYVYEYVLYENGDTDLIMQHRRLWEDFHNQTLPKGFEVHHKDHDRQNNLVSNLLAIEKVLHTTFFHNIDSNILPEGVWC